jgi:DNA-directed RNA polymerase specialized sigma24 family protein
MKCNSVVVGQHSGEVSRKRVVCHAAEQHDLQRVIQRAIQLLPSRYRPVVYLRYAEDMTLEAIGHQLSIPESTAKTYFQRARPLLRASLDLYHPYHTRSRQAERVW